MSRLPRIATLIVVAITIAPPTFAQTVRGVVVDQTGLPLPGVTVQVLDGAVLVTSVTTGPDGSFVIDAAIRGETIGASLEGFEPLRVPRAGAARIVLEIARATDSTTVIAPTVIASSPTATLLGNTLTATNIARLPSSRMKARESLPLLPSVIRGSDGLMRLGGAQAHETPLLLDGFNITDPATGISSLNLPFEAVRSVDLLRDPMSINYGGLLGGIVSMESRPGSDTFTKGFQGFIPRPRFSSPGAGRLEGIFPRGHVAGSAAGGRIRYFTGAEYDYERIPVPNVTVSDGPEVIEDSAIIFGRLDAHVTSRQNLTFEAFAFPSRTRSFGLSPRRDEMATADISARDLFAGLTHRLVTDQTNALTIQIGVLAHDVTLAPNGSGPSYLTPGGWQNSWFASARRTALRYTALAAWERITTIHGRTHDFTMTGEIGATRLHGSVAERSIVVNNQSGEVVRTIDFGAPSSIAAHDWPTGLALRDVWRASDRVQLDAGLRADYSRYGGTEPSARAGVRYEMNETGTTVLKAGYGTFVGGLPLAVPSYSGYAPRIDRRIDPTSGDAVTLTFTPTVGQLRLPRARALTVGFERQIMPRLDAQVSATVRKSTHLATLLVPATSGPLLAESTGSASYRELQLSVRRTWEHDQQLFVSYVRSSSRGELNDFSALYRALAVPLVQPGGVSQLATDAPHRVLVWSTFDLPRRVVISPVSEWRSGFPFSKVDHRYFYADTPNSRSYPAFFSVDMVVYKTFTVKKRSADLGIQVFNITNHNNPRDVYSVVGAPRFGDFTNSVGPIVRGYMLLKW